MLEMDQCVDAMADLTDGSCIGNNAIALIGSHAPLLLLDQAIDGLAYLLLIHHRATSHSRLVIGRPSSSSASKRCTQDRTASSVQVWCHLTLSGGHTEKPMPSTRMLLQPGYLALNALATRQFMPSHVTPITSSSCLLSR